MEVTVNVALRAATIAPQKKPAPNNKEKAPLNLDGFSGAIEGAVLFGLADGQIITLALRSGIVQGVTARNRLESRVSGIHTRRIGVINLTAPRRSKRLNKRLHLAGVRQ